MKRFVAEFPLPENFLLRLLSISRNEDTMMVLNSNRQQSGDDRYSSFDLVAAIGVKDQITGGASAFSGLQEFLDKKQDWVFGAFTYDLKNQIEKLTSSNHDGLYFPDYHFFQPEYILTVAKGESKVFIHYPEEIGPEKAKELFDRITSAQITGDASKKPAPGKISSRITKEKYLENVSRIKEHIQRGDIYEMNYCMEFYADGIELDPQKTFSDLNELSPMPFSCFYKSDDRYLICASPERFLKKSGEKIISQPIKGTARRSGKEADDEIIRKNLFNDPKERAENVMIVDLVRNDLSRTARQGSVKVEELYGIYSFRSLHHMISTVVSEKESLVRTAEIIKAAFPMGSMTGAPKIKAMQLIEEFEQTKRGLYSGSVGYFNPEGDFDLNVVIRSILYNAKRKYLSFMAGSAITINSDPEHEYEECMLKAQSMINVLRYD